MKRIMLPVLVCCTALQLAAQDLNTLHNMLIKFYQYQRAGLASGSADNANSGFTNASHNGDSYNGNPLDGGWYDAGDYIKFGMNLGYTLYCLLKGYDIFPGAYSSSGSVPDVLMQAKFATDYLLKAVIDNNTVVLDVGIASEEHRTWGVVNAGGRSGNQIKLCNGGDIPATYAACLALMSVLYRKHDSDYADQCLAKAKVAFAFAKNKFNANQNYCTPQQKDGAALYDYPTVDGQKNQQINDRMVAAGVELYRATVGTDGADPTYKTWATKSIINFYNCIGYSYIGPLAAFEAWRQGLVSGAGALSQNITFINGRIQTSGAFANVYQNSGWGTARDMGSVAFEYALAYVISGAEATRETYLKRVNDHINWLTGQGGGRSYICGVNSGPTRIHYRTTNYGAVPGAVVSGPDGDGNWSDDGSANYGEVAIDYNAGVVGAVAFLKAVSDNSALRVTKAFEADQTVDVDMTAKTVTFSATLSKSTPWTIDVTGAFGSKKISNTGTNISGTWDGSADEGFFLAGEVVTARLTVDGAVSALDLQKIRPVPVEIIKTQKPEPKATDKLVDDFDDADSINKFGGTWSAIGTGTGLLGTSFTYSTLENSPSIQLKANVKTPAPETFSILRTTFSSSGGPSAVGPIKSIAFDMKGSADANVCVELEQASVTDGAYHQVTFPITTYANSYRIPVARFAQPDWKTGDVPLDLNNIVALRFSVYDSTGRISIDIDNIAIEDLAVSVDETFVTRKSRSFNTPVYAKGSLHYAIPRTITGPVTLSIFDLTGRNVFDRQYTDHANSTLAINLDRLPAGMYTAVFSDGGSAISERLKFIMTR